jgi:hypothetical protein
MWIYWVIFAFFSSLVAYIFPQWGGPTFSDEGNIPTQWTKFLDDIKDLKGTANRKELMRFVAFRWGADMDGNGRVNFDDILFALNRCVDSNSDGKWSQMEVFKAIVQTAIFVAGCAAVAYFVYAPVRALFHPTISTWVHCEIYFPKKQKYERGVKVASREYRFTAHVDTGNSADTTISAKVFDYLYPPLAPNSYERQGLKFEGLTTIVGATGHEQTRPKYSGMKVQFDGVRSKSGKALAFKMDVTRRHDDKDYVPGKYGYHDLLVSNRDMKLLLEKHGHTIKVVDYNDFVRNCRCKCYH